jgi:hypothetical protein
LIELSPFHDDWSQCRISRRFCRWSHYQNLFLEADFGSGGRCDSNTPIGILVGDREEAAVKFSKITAVEAFGGVILIAEAVRIMGVVSVCSGRL